MGRIDITTSKSKEEIQRDWKGMLPGLVISLICLVIVFYMVDIRKLINALRLANYSLVGLSLAATLLWLSVRGIVWRIILQEKASFRQVFLTLNEGYLLNNLLPFRLGELGRAFLLGRKANL
ncbi:MAG: lysylphosphatidylglycerol synthase transmembrane domain-containing protein, partial [Anaerolineaceae bacterium]